MKEDECFISVETVVADLRSWEASLLALSVVRGLSYPTLPVATWRSFRGCEHLTRALLGDRRLLPSPLLSVGLFLSVLVLGDVAAVGRSWWGQ